MVIEDPNKKKELDKVPNVDKNGDPIYKIDDSPEKSEDELPEIGDISNTAEDDKFKDTPQDLKDETSQD